jgi:hypothetical protein
MKVYADPKLPLKPQGALEKYLLYTFESRERWLILKGITLLGALGLWVFTEAWIFGVVAAFSLFHLYLGIEARAVCRLIRRASAGEDERVC